MSATGTYATVLAAMGEVGSQFSVHLRNGGETVERGEGLLLGGTSCSIRRGKIVTRALFAILLVAAGGTWAAEPQPQSVLLADPKTFPTLLHPNCSHCQIENVRRKDELRGDDRVLCWLQVQADGYVNDGAIPIRFFLNKYRVLSDGWGVFINDIDAGYARGFVPDGQPFQFYGWRNGVMVMKSKDGTLYSCLTGIAFDGPRKGTRLQPEPTLLNDWGYWEKRYPASVAYFMYDKYQPVEWPGTATDDSLKTRAPADSRLPADTPVLGVWKRHSGRS